MKYILLFLAATAFMYLLFAFTIAELNPMDWERGIRALFAFIEAFICVSILISYDSSKPPYEPNNTTNDTRTTTQTTAN